MVSKIKGDITELTVMLQAINSGIVVSVPHGDYHKYDQIWDIDNKLFRIQVKTARQKSKYPNIIFNCYSVVNGKKYKYTKQDIDYFVTVYQNEVYVVPVEQCSLEKTLWLSIPAEFESQKDRLTLAEDYTLTKRLESFKK